MVPKILLLSKQTYNKFKFSGHAVDKQGSLDFGQSPELSVQLQVVHFDLVLLQQLHQLADRTAEQRVQLAGLRPTDVDHWRLDGEHLRRSTLQLRPVLHLRGKIGKSGNPILMGHELMCIFN